MNAITFEQFEYALKLAKMDGADAMYVNCYEQIIFCKMGPPQRSIGHIDSSGNYFCDI